MKTNDFFYELPKELIAQTPLEERESSRLLTLYRDTGDLEEGVFSSITQYFREGDVLVRNTTRVIPARLFGINKDSGSKIEFLLLRRIENDDWEALVKPGRRAKTGSVFYINEELQAAVLHSTQEGGRLIRLNYNGPFEEILERAGQTPLPPYITAQLSEKECYQTVYARESGSVAAPTAGLHFTKKIFEELQNRGVLIVDILLHVGLGTFRPVKVENIEDHHMHAEYYEISEKAARIINNAKCVGKRIFAVGTTACRTLESAANTDGVIHAQKGWTDIFIAPGYQFKAVDALITNFHLPESTLLMLVSAFATRENILCAYEYAIQKNFRFFSFGDAMLLL